MKPITRIIGTFHRPIKPFASTAPSNKIFYAMWCYECVYITSHSTNWEFVNCWICLPTSLAAAAAAAGSDADSHRPAWPAILAQPRITCKHQWRRIERARSRPSAAVNRTTGDHVTHSVLQSDVWRTIHGLASIYPSVFWIYVGTTAIWRSWRLNDDV